MRIESLSNSRLQATLFVGLLVVGFATRHPVLMALYVAAAVCVMLANLHAFSRASVRERNAAVVFVATLTVILPLSVIRSETGVIHYIGSLISLGAAFVLSRNLQVYWAASRAVLIAAQLAVVVYLARVGLADFPLETMLPDSSSNGVTSYLVLLQANYCLVNFLLTRRAGLSSAVLTLLICTVGYARGSILSAAGIVTIGLVSLLPARTYAAVLLRMLLFVGLCWVVYRLAAPAVEFVDANTKLGSGLFDVHRYTILKEYLGRIDALTLWTGASYDGTSIVSQYNGNPHNSYIRAHYIFGLPYLLLILGLPLYLFNRRHSLGVLLYSVAMGGVIFFRSLTEPLLFPTLFDFFFYASCFVVAARPQRLPARRMRRPRLLADVSAQRLLPGATAT